MASHYLRPWDVMRYNWSVKGMIKRPFLEGSQSDLKRSSMQPYDGVQNAMDYTWTTGEDLHIQHEGLIGRGAFGEIHKVLPFSTHLIFQLLNVSTGEVSTPLPVC